jgi:energy-coupling factor transport system permease protein
VRLPLAVPGAATAPLGRRNPVAKFAAALLLSAALVLSLDPVAPAVALAAELALVPAFGLRYRDLLARTWWLLLAAGATVVSMTLFAATRTGSVLLDAGPLVVTTGVLAAGAGLALRMLAVAVPGVLVAATTDPTDLADALVQNLRVPARYAIGSLAALRLLPLLAEEWEHLRLARRARGLDSGGNPVTALRLFASTLFGLLVAAIRRGIRLAVAMEARGFDSGVPRTAARTQRFGGADAALVVAAALLGVAAIALSLALGTFRPLLA